jgi:endonuclease YncB( thermonuclease family)
MWEYWAHVAQVIDGDTYVLDIDLGFHVHTEQHIRLKGAYCPELRAPGGALAKLFAVGALMQSDHTVTVITEKNPVRSFERYVARVVLRDGTDLAELLIKNGHATSEPTGPLK